MKTRDTEYTQLLRFIAVIVVTLVTLFCLFPIVLIISGSFTSDESLIRNGYHLFPQDFSVSGYTFVLRYPDTILKAYGVTAFTTIVGTAIGLFLITMSGYVLQRKDFKYRNQISFFIYFTTLFGGGLIPWYIMMTRYLKLTDSLGAIIFPGLMSPFLIILMRSFIKTTLPDELVESAKIDGAGEFRIYFSIVLRLALPGIASVGLFLALGYWNDWFATALFINDPNKWQLQFYLFNVMNTLDAIRNLALGTGLSIDIEMPGESGRLAIAVIVTGPIIFLYPFVQRYFVKGLTIGAVKG